MIRATVRIENLYYWALYGDHTMAGKYCTRERAYVDEDYEECESCNLLCEVKK
jgi:hypothetical protein